MYLNRNVYHYFVYKVSAGVVFVCKIGALSFSMSFYRWILPWLKNLWYQFQNLTRSEKIGPLLEGLIRSMSKILGVGERKMVITSLSFILDTQNTSQNVGFSALFHVVCDLFWLGQKWGHQGSKGQKECGFVNFLPVSENSPLKHAKSSV